jgi:CBS domain-containing protein
MRFLKKLCGLDIASALIVLWVINREEWRRDVKNYIVKDLMVPISEYATVPKGATLFEAVLALEKAQEEFDHTKYRHRAILVMDVNNRVIGKLSHLDVIRALEPKYDPSEKLTTLEQYGFSEKFIWHQRKERRQEVAPIVDIGKVADSLKVEDLMQAPTEGEYVDQETSLDVAAHQLVVGSHYALLAMDGDRIVGVLRLTDVFAALFHAMKKYQVDRNNKTAKPDEQHGPQEERGDG